MSDRQNFLNDKRVAEGEQLLSAIKLALQMDATVHGDARETHPSYREAMMGLVYAFDQAATEVIDRSDLVKSYDLD